MWMVLALSALISHFKLPIYFHEIWKGLECQRGNQHSLTLAPQWGEAPCPIMGAQPSRGSGQHVCPGWARVALSSQPLWVQQWASRWKRNKSGIYAATHKAGPWARIRGLACQLPPPPQTQLSAPPQPLGTGEGQSPRHRETRYVMPGVKALKKCCLVAMKWR